MIRSRLAWTSPVLIPWLLFVLKLVDDSCCGREILKFGVGVGCVPFCWDKRHSITLTSLKAVPISFENWEKSVLFPVNRFASFRPFAVSRYNFRSLFLDKSRITSYGDNMNVIFRIGGVGVLLDLWVALLTLAALLELSTFDNLPAGIRGLYPLGFGR